MCGGFILTAQNQKTNANNGFEQVTYTIQQQSLMGQNNALAKAEAEKTKKILVVITAYSSTVDQTDDTPFITANGSFVRDGIVANNMLPFGTKIKIPELPIKETNPLRPMSPYAVSKVYGDYLMRNYYHSYGLDTVVSRAFNHEGAGRGLMFVTSVITSQIMKLKLGETDKITIGNINAFRDWSHVNDINNGYLLLAEKGSAGEVYNQGSMRTNSVLSYILIGLEEAGWKIDNIKTFNGKNLLKSY